MPIIRAQVVLPYTNGAPEDIAVNVWHFRTSNLLQATWDSITAAMDSFYTAIQNIYNNDMDLAGATIRFYDLADAKPRPPRGEQLLGLTGTGSNESGPQEVAICLSYHGARIAGVNPQRQRGRIYLGPLSSTILISPIVPGSTVATIIGAATTLLATSGTATWDWVVYSQAQADDPGDFIPADTSVIGGWVDNAWDTQRRRGMAPTIRTPFGSSARSSRDGGRAEVSASPVPGGLDSAP